MATRVSQAEQVEGRLHAAMTARHRDHVAYAAALNDAIALRRAGSWRA